MENPWNIRSIYELQYFNCPSCIFRNISKQEFVNHAYEYHPESIDYLIKIDDDSLSDVLCPWIEIETKIKVEKTDEESIFNNSLSKDELNEPGNELIDDNLDEIKPEDNFEVTLVEGNPDPLNIGMLNPNVILEETHKCDHCEESFTSSENLDMHIKAVHEGIYKFKCGMCEKSFIFKGNLKKHIEIVHEGKKNFRCDICGKFFTQAGNLRTHVKSIHEGIKDHKCKTCGKCYSEVRFLQKHISSVHEGLKNHKCEKCGKAFAQASDLKRHVNNVHDGVKNHICGFCGKACSQAVDLRKHISSVHEGVKHKCETCGKTFGRLDTLKNHIMKCS